MRSDKLAMVLSVASGACAALASGMFLFYARALPSLPTGEATTAGAEARGWSVVTLGVALPLLMVGLLTARRGSVRGRIAWAGALAYLLYTFLELAVSPPFTPVYLICVAAFACALIALVAVVASVEVGALPRLFTQAPRRATAIYALAFAAVVAFAVLRRTARGQVAWPQGDAVITQVVQSLDLGLLVPVCVATGVTLLLRRPLGYLLGGAFLVFAFCMGAALTAMAGAAAWAAGTSAQRAVLLAMLWVVAAALAVGFFRQPAPARFERHAHA